MFTFGMLIETVDPDLVVKVLDVENVDPSEYYLDQYVVVEYIAPWADYEVCAIFVEDDGMYVDLIRRK